MTLLPAEYRPTTAFIPDSVDHFVAYLAVGGLLVVVMRAATRGRQISLSLAAYSGILELAQTLSPGRVPSLDDFFASSVGAVVGTTLACALLSRLENTSGRRSARISASGSYTLERALTRDR